MKDETREALRALVEKLEAIHSDPSYQGVWTMYAVHGGVYDGPQYADELARAKDVLRLTS